MNEIATKVCIYCCKKATVIRKINNSEIGLCKEHEELSNDDILYILGEPVVRINYSKDNS